MTQGETTERDRDAELVRKLGDLPTRAMSKHAEEKARSAGRRALARAFGDDTADASIEAPRPAFTGLQVTSTGAAVLSVGLNLALAGVVVTYLLWAFAAALAIHG